MPKLPPPSLPSEGDEDPVWGDLFGGFISRPAPNPSPATKTPASTPPLQRKQPNKPRKLSIKGVPPVGAGNR
jgi:hypothetical protein